jgi:hypothetical protein
MRGLRRKRTAGFMFEGSKGHSIGALDVHHEQASWLIFQHHQQRSMEL